ncbi:DUF342 domain-containing protein [Microlunatus elymi]|uniref:DUF342 domain-containing protein n=1 Tax=Microlunatus elymi TaxID=2596828 RepID=A0A516PUL7_9ACTN|nr:DUF342 domain-containing protein [Microlunatus elymi]QDP94852.1 DUF342 domain-containing protein [Microlunatus elymi]
MRRVLRAIGTLVGAAILIVAGTAVASAQGTAARAYTCTGGDVPSGNYTSLIVTGNCAVADGAMINVSGNVYVAANAVLDAQSAPATITVGHNVTAMRGSLLGLGCQPPSYTGNSAHPCTVDPDGHSTITVRGNVTAFGANTVLLNGISVTGNVTLAGGGGEIPWSIKNNTIGRNLTVTGQTAIWVGVLFNQVGGNVTLADITVTDPDPVPRVFIVRNTVRHNLVCVGLRPGVSGGFIPGEVNTVGGRAIGQCAALV